MWFPKVDMTFYMHFLGIYGPQREPLCFMWDLLIGGSKFGSVASWACIPFLNNSVREPLVGGKAR